MQSISIEELFKEKNVGMSVLSAPGQVTPGTYKLYYFLHILYYVILIFMWCIKQYTNSANNFFIVKLERSDISFNTITTLRCHRYLALSVLK